MRKNRFLYRFRPGGVGPAPVRGAAILAAMVTVALVASIATVATQQQWQLAQVEAAERSRQQALWLLRGALDWSRLVLRQDAQSSGAAEVDHLAEPWAVELQETRLSTFLAAEGGVADADASADTDAAYLAGGMTDAQAKLNVLGMVYGSQERHAPQLQRLFALLGLPMGEFALLRQGLLDAANADVGDARPLLPLRLDDLVWLGVSPSTVQALQPYAAVAAQTYKINLNTAPAVVIAAASGVALEAAQALVVQRQQQHFASVQQAREALESQGAALHDDDFAVASQWFEVRGQVRMPDVVLGMQARVQRTGATVRTQQVQTQGLALSVQPDF